MWLGLRCSFKRHAGWSSASSTFLECIRFGTAPNVLVLTERDAVLVVGGAVAWEIDQHGPTIVIVPAFPSIPDQATIFVDSVGDVYLEDDAFDLLSLRGAATGRLERFKSRCGPSGVEVNGRLAPGDRERHQRGQRRDWRA